MATVDTLRNDLIDKLLAISNKEYLTALTKLVDNSAVDNDIIKLTSSQKELLNLSEKDIAEGRLIEQETLNKADLEWLKGL